MRLAIARAVRIVALTVGRAILTGLLAIYIGLRASLILLLLRLLRTATVIT